MASLLGPSVLAAAIGAVLAPLPEPNRYIPLEPFELALKADMVVDGVITHFDEAQPVESFGRSGKPVFKVRVVEVLVGEVDAVELAISEFVNWTCAGRYAPYDLNQRAIFFLWYGRDESGSINLDKPLMCMGSGNEGECPVVGESILHQGVGLRDLTRDQVEAFGHPFSGVVSQRAEFVAAVRSLRGCFKWNPSPPNGRRFPEFSPTSLRQTCTDAELEAFMNSSDLARATVRDSQEYRELRKRDAVEQGK